MATAPYCNVEVATPNANPGSPKGIARIPPGANLQQVINIINNNFQHVQLGQYVENKAARRSKIVRIFDPADHNVYVDVNQIVGVQFVNSTTGQIINWAR